MSTTPPDQPPTGPGEDGKDWLDPRRALEGVLLGLLAVIVIAIAAIISLAVEGAVSGEVGTIATGAFGVVGTIVGAYFGINVGTKAGAQGKEEAKAAATQANAMAYNSQVEASAAKAQARVLASHLPEDKARNVNQEAQEEGQAAADRVRDAWQQAGALPSA